MTDKEKLQRYAELKSSVAVAEAELDELKPQIVVIIGDNDGIETDFGNFTVSRRRTYTYPEDIQRKEKDLKNDKKLAEQLGVATYTEAPILVYKPNKNDQDEA